MTIIEAIKSGKRFRRKGQVNYYSGPNSHEGTWFNYEELVADDWEVEEKKVEITFSQLIAAYDRAHEKNVSLWGPSAVTTPNDIAVELNLI